MPDDAAGLRAVIKKLEAMPPTPPTPKISAAQRRRLHRVIERSSNKCADCRSPVRYWNLVKGIPTCNVCGGTTPLGGTIDRQPHYPAT